MESVLDWLEVVAGCSMGSVCPEPLAAGSVSAGAMVVVASTPVGAALSAVGAVVVAPALTALDAAAADGRRPCPHRTTMASWRPRCVVVCMDVCMDVGI